MSTAAATHWDVIVHYLKHAFSLFGEPEALARQNWFSRKEHKLLCEYLRPLGAMLRRLIFIAALALTPATHPPKPERKFRATPPAKTITGAHFNIDDATTWRVRFNLMDRRRPRRHGCSASPTGAPKLLWKPNFVFTAASAQRLEAFYRAYTSRDQRALKLARKLVADARAAHAFIARPNKNLAAKPLYHTLFEIVPRARDAHKAWIARGPQLTDSS